ncbi:GAF domain-containing protein [Spirulina subsalsa FACHB-351]|uniref:GAF domain-containing protein n=1 Tax=Spirulina subsalsa FACHB-351 TaxID=234711 RepID=A0ABT3L0H9_9CYAN|nr:GAF domain-containing protein [Spirulina subsalsa]MCW6034677.1 GAF domain-containing protein [Spirulina subsalsa FACHB-351]
MSDRDLSQLSPAELIQEIETLRQEQAKLQKIKLAFDAQDELVRSLISMGRAATGRLMLRSMLLQTTKISIKLTEAEESSLFLLNQEGRVTESVLARGATLREERDVLIGKVLDQGLAGWVVRHRQIGLVRDTKQDERWVTLPNQPYTVGSALCVPILRGKVLLGILTLTHPKPEHFNQESAELIQMCATQMALALDNARLYMQEHQQREKSQAEDEEYLERERDLSQLGMFIIADTGKFLYANNQVAEMFAYDFGELVALDSILKLVSTRHYHVVADQFSQCIKGFTSTLSCRCQGQKKNRHVMDIDLYATRTKFFGKYILIGVIELV